MSAAPFTRRWIKELAVRSILDPRSAAADLTALSVPRDALWTWLLLVAALNGLLYTLFMPEGAQLGMPLPPLVLNPLVLSVLMVFMLALMTWFFAAAGRVMGGAAGFEDMLLVTCWLQSLRIAFQFFVTFVTLLSPGIGGVLAVVGGLWSLFILVHFLTAVHRFDTPLKGVGTMVMAVFGLAFAMTLILTLMGATPPEV